MEGSTAERPLTFGEKAVGLTFNPDQNPEVHQIKSAYAAIIDMLHNMRTGNGEVISAGKARHLSCAITMAEDAQMRAVKGITWKD